MLNKKEAGEIIKKYGKRDKEKETLEEYVHRILKEEEKKYGFIGYHTNKVWPTMKVLCKEYKLDYLKATTEIKYNPKLWLKTINKINEDNNF